MDPTGVKKRLEDYEQMLLNYTLMRTNNKMKDFEAESEEWWEVTKELEKNLAHHRADEKIMRYKLEAYQKNFPNFIYGSSKSIEVSSQDEETETRPGGTIQKEEVQTKEPQDFRSGSTQEEDV